MQRLTIGSWLDVYTGVEFVCTGEYDESGKVEGKSAGVVCGDFRERRKVSESGNIKSLFTVYCEQ